MTDETEAVVEALRRAGVRIVPEDTNAETHSNEARSRGRRLYDWWSRRGVLYPAVMRLSASMRTDSFEALDADHGDRVLDLACGPGTNFERLRDDVGANGVVVGLDYSNGMVDRARRVIDDHDWSNVVVGQADAAETCGPDELYDAALTTFALHTMAEAQSVVENVHRTLVPGGRFVVLDARPIQEGAGKRLNPVYERLISWTVNHQRGLDTLPLLQETFESVTVVETYDAGTGYLAVAEKGVDD